MSKKEKIVLILLFVIIAFIDVTGLPGVLKKIYVEDLDPNIIPIMINFVLIGILSVIIIKSFKITYTFGFTKKGLKSGMKRYGLHGVLVGIISLISYIIGLSPFDYSPTLLKILIEGILYCIGVGIVQEFYIRGLFLNCIEELAPKKKNRTTIAIIISSVVFGIGHIPGVISMGIGVIIFKLVSTISMGLYLGAIYKKTNNLWIPIIIHTFINICALPYCFTQNMRYETITIVILTIIYSLLAIYSWTLLYNKKRIVNN